MAKGTIKRLITGRGFGFIKAEDGREVFFHMSGLLDAEFDSLEEGQAVEFDVESGPKGPRATNVKTKQQRRKTKKE
ncbi:MAG TPA: cold shock domain-containing protein [bacterium (Candidatus Stahlbacteria)]|nr:cold shock domain-containing protein [Candidatus Stahlbacteria bacterium]